jgi:CheY-like chemotaxis protein
MQKKLTGKNVLLVDDEPDLLEVMNQILTLNGATVYLATNGLEAMDLIMKQKIDFILSDVCMPLCDGVELLKKVRTLFPSPLPFFFLTGYAANYNRNELVELGANDIFSKPFDVMLLVEAIQQATIN